MFEFTGMLVKKIGIFGVARENPGEMPETSGLSQSC